MAEADTNKPQLIRDPNFAKNRIFLGNLPSCTKEELESICHPYGKVLGSLVQKNFGFVQFESEEIANKVAFSLTKSTFKGNVITVRNAGAKKVQPANAQTAASAVRYEDNKVQHPDYNDCEIIVVDRRNTKYAEYIEDRLKRMQLRVDVLYPNEDVPLGKVLANISSRGCLYAILVTNQHEEHNSITVNILYGQPAEHRNMPVDDALKLIGKDFQNKMAVESSKRLNSSHLPQPVPIIPATNVIAPPLKDRHPESIQILLNLLADNLPLTGLQYERIIKYLNERRTLQLKAELGETVESIPDPEIELQKKILDILNKPSVAETHYELLYPTLQSIKDDFRVMELLKDERVQKALDSLMDSSLVGTIETHMKF